MKCGEWAITSRTRRPHLYLSGSNVAVCGRGYTKPGEPRIRLPDTVSDKCHYCEQFEKRLKKYPDGVVDGIAQT